MSLIDFRTLGRSGLVVSPLALGTMTFGPGAWGADSPTSRAIFDTYLAAGGNFVDTADIYSDGESERLVGHFIRESGKRDDVVLATKFGFNGAASPLTATQAGGGNPNAGGWKRHRRFEPLAASEN
jgi:aryl-alcohol dehydrogenase-like predicted oxidoreductase